MTIWCPCGRTTPYGIIAPDDCKGKPCLFPEPTGISKMTDDREMTKLCADASGIKLWWSSDHPEIMNGLVSTGDIYDPIHDDAQAMALLKQHKLSLSYGLSTGWIVQDYLGLANSHENLNRAIVACVAKMQTYTQIKDAQP